MIDFKNDEHYHRALALVRYIRAGSEDAEQVEDAYYSGLRFHHMFKLWRRLRCYNAPDSTDDHEIEVYYARWLSRYKLDRLVNLGDWKAILECVAQRLQCRATNRIGLSSSAVKAYERALIIARALKYGV